MDSIGVERFRGLLRKAKAGSLYLPVFHFMVGSIMVNLMIDTNLWLDSFWGRNNKSNVDSILAVSKSLYSICLCTNTIQGDEVSSNLKYKSASCLEYMSTFNELEIIGLKTAFVDDCYVGYYYTSADDDTDLDDIRNIFFGASTREQDHNDSMFLDTLLGWNGVIITGDNKLLNPDKNIMFYGSMGSRSPIILSLTEAENIFNTVKGINMDDELFVELVCDKACDRMYNQA